MIGLLTAALVFSAPQSFPDKPEIHRAYEGMLSEKQDGIVVGDPEMPVPPLHYRTVRVTTTKPKYELKLAYPQFVGESRLENFANKEISAMTTAPADQWLKETLEGLKDYSGPAVPWTYEVSSVVSLLDSSLISLYQTEYWFSGGAHPNRVLRTSNFWNSPTGPTTVTISDILKPGVSKADFTNHVLLPHLDKMGADWVREGSVKSLTDAQLNNFVITPAGITWLFSPYEMGPYVQGEFMAKIPYAKLADYLRFDTALKGRYYPAMTGPAVAIFANQVTYFEKMIIPAGSTLVLELLNAKSGEVIGRSTQAISGAPPYRFQISFSVPKDGGGLKLRGDINSHSRTLFTIDQVIGGDVKGPYRMIRAD